MSSPAEELFKSLKTYSEIEHLIQNGETEGLYLECKSPQSPQMNAGMKAQLAEAISGFANTGGGVILWGVSTVKHAHTKLDVLTQIEPIAQSRAFARHVDNNIHLLTTPVIRTVPSVVLHARTGDTKGIVVTYIPQSPGDPVRSNMDKHFHFRNGDEFSILPYEILKRMFLGTQGPDLGLLFKRELVKREDDGSWKIPIIVANSASAVAEHILVSVTFLNPEACENIAAKSFQNVSEINPGMKMFVQRNIPVIHRGINTVIGEFRVLMKKKARPRRVLKLRIEVYASKMRAKTFHFRIQLAQAGFDVKCIKEDFVY